MCKFKGWPPSFSPPTSRWAILQIALSASFFCIAVFIALYAISITEGKAMIPQWLDNLLPTFLIISFSMGIILFLASVGFIIWCLVKGPTENDSNKDKSNIGLWTDIAIAISIIVSILSNNRRNKGNEKKTKRDS